MIREKAIETLRIEAEATEADFKAYEKRAAKIAHAESDHRREAQLLQWASRKSTAVAERERRWLDAQLATVLAHPILED